MAPTGCHQTGFLSIRVAICLKASTLRGKLGTDRVGKRDLVLEPTFESFCVELERQARENTERIREQVARLATWKPPAAKSTTSQSASWSKAARWNSMPATVPLPTR